MPIRSGLPPGLFLLPLYGAVSNSEKIMSQTHSKSRQKAEIAFANAQSQFFARNAVVEELDFLALAREEKTQRLREARLAKELKDRKSVTAALIAKRARTA
jgi:energy-coupling factor transporter ATP-binding protein EcfA2